MANKPRFPGDPVGKAKVSYTSAFTDVDERTESWKEDELAKSELVKGPLKSGDFPQPPFQDFAGGKSASYTKANRAALEFQDAGKLPARKGSRQADWRGSK
jgi:hypothetical protein